MEETKPFVEEFGEITDDGCVIRQRTCDYGVVASDTLSGLRRKVLELYGQGFRPQGGVAFGEGVLYQAMVQEFID